MHKVGQLETAADTTRRDPRQHVGTLTARGRDSPTQAKAAATPQAHYHVLAQGVCADTNSERTNHEKRTFTNSFALLQTATSHEGLWHYTDKLILPVFSPDVGEKSPPVLLSRPEQCLYSPKL